MLRDIAELFIDPVLRIWTVFANYIPNIIAALLFVLFGLFIARVLSSLLEQFLRRIKLDTYTSQVGINEVMVRFGFGRSPSAIIGFIVYWSLIMVFFVSAANIMNLTVISEILERFLVGFIPRIAAAIFIAFGGLTFAKFISDVVTDSAAANNLRGGKSLSKIVHFVILVFTAIAAVEQLGVDMKIIRSSLNILFASLGLAFAIAAGLGAKDIARDIIKGMLTENKDEK
ncbi:MAG: hypothetical protein A2X28_10460 [Elusimicrobia bacterium GWA2_56_46]|nr:MAG: hypothetical protein A2X28_10460 [Elusimicrobia bacterium GWA2_56_46]OGR55065.1 MAG: hypothetical protein A2X39_09370 [Elusimicrobia bacterium GWC2_56_31]HBB67139.1 hypothetical protein [Elusimicrobiota bacterium]HBW23784.1 hypothetical protein [Elusimicrobiota bacterium]